MNKKGSVGSTFFVGLIAICYFMFGMIIYQFLKVPIDAARTSMSCSSPSSWGDMGICLVIGGIVPLVIIAILSISGGVITDKLLK